MKNRTLSALVSTASMLLLLAAPANAEPTDAEIASKVRVALEVVDGLEDVRVDVRAGVVILEGTTPSGAAADRAEALVAKMTGVVGVENRLTRPVGVGDRLTPALARLRTLAGELVAWLPLLGVALVIVILAWFLARFVGSWQWVFTRLTRNRFAQDLLRHLVRTLIVVGGVLLALEILDATALVGAVLGTAGIAGLAIAFAFRDLFENYLASILLSIRRPFGPGDHVRIGDDEGKVVMLTTRATILRTLDGNHLRVLNAEVYKARILNYTRNALRRFEFDIGVGVEEDLVDARRLGHATLEAMDGVVESPGPVVVIESLGDSSVVLRHYGWVDQEQADFQKVRGEAIRRVKLAFEERGFDLPEPIQRVRVERFTPPAAAKAGKPTVEEAPNESDDIRPDRDLDHAIAAERAGAGTADLLTEASQSELEPAD